MDLTDRDVQNRLVGALAGLLMIVVAVALRASIGDALGGVLAVGGVGLLIYAVLGRRVKRFGPTGVELFEQVKELTATRIEAEPSTNTLSGHGQAAAAIRAAKTPDELADVLVRLIDRPESPTEQAARVRRDDERRAINRRMGPGPTDVGAR